MTQEGGQADLGWILEGMPHRPPMRLLDAIVTAENRRLVARARIGPDHLLLRAGRVSPLLAIELFAQAAAALLVYRSGRGAPPMGAGYLLGTRKLSMTVDGFAPGDTLEVAVEELWGAGTLAQFEGRLTRSGSGELVASGAITVGG